MKTGKTQTYPWCVSAASRLNCGGFSLARLIKQAAVTITLHQLWPLLVDHLLCERRLLFIKWLTSGKSRAVGVLSGLISKPEQQGNHSSRGAAELLAPRRKVFTHSSNN